MKALIAGSRKILDYDIVDEAIRQSGFDITLVISGAASGVDQLGEEWARKHNVPISSHPANWARFGRSAGFKRNIEMLDEAEVVIAIWDGKSKGTKHTITEAEKRKLPTFVKIATATKLQPPRKYVDFPGWGK